MVAATASAHGVLVVDKAAGVSSHGVVALARKAFATRAVGHAGTLDPMATGVLVLAIGEGRKLLRYLSLDDKRYAARIVVGAETDTLDAEGMVTTRAALPSLELERVRQVSQRFVGCYRQRAPAVSAIKQGGEPLFRRVRRGEVVEPPERDVVVHALDVQAVCGAEIRLDVRCGKGFYVRALARDLGRELGSVAHLSELRRLSSGPFDLSLSVEQALLARAARGPEAEAARAELAARVLSIPEALGPVPRLRLDEAGARDAVHGRPVALERVASAAGPPLEDQAEPVLLCDGEGQPLALARVREGELTVVRGFRLS